MVESFEHSAASNRVGDDFSAFHHEASMILASNPIEPSRGRGNPIEPPSHSTRPPELPDVTIENNNNPTARNENNIGVHNRVTSGSESNAVGIGQGGRGGDGGDARSNSSSSSRVGDVTSGSSSQVGDVSSGSSSQGGDASARTGDSSASITDNSRYEDNSLFIVNDPPDLPDLPGGTSGVSSRTQINGIGSHESHVYEAKEGDAFTFGISVGIPGAGGGGLGFGSSSTYTSEEGLQRLDNAAQTLNAGTGMFWGQVLQRDADPTNDGISRHLTGQGARLLNQTMKDSGGGQ